jgi:hypothetical protein
MANSKPKRERPKSKAGRRRVAEINTELNRGKPSPDRRTALEAERDRLSPIVEAPLPKKESSSLSVRTEQELAARKAPAQKETWEFPKTPEALEKYIADMARREEESLHADPVRRRRAAAHHIALTTDNPLRAYADKHSSSGVIWEALIWDRGVQHPSAKAEWVADIYAEVDRRYAEDPDWFRRVYADGTAFKTDTATAETPVVPELKPEPQPPQQRPDVAPALDPLVAASADLARRSELILNSDAWLTRLADHSPAMRQQIMASISNELLRAGVVSSDWCARTYNFCRPKSLAAFPERRF